MISKSTKPPSILLVYIERLLRPFLRGIRLKGARAKGVHESGNFKVLLNRGTALGSKGQTLLVAQDRVLMFNILNYGIYEKPTIDFFRNISTNSPTSHVFLDIGANCGLISRAIALRNSSISEVIAVEPIRQNIEALQANLKNLLQPVKIIEVGLDLVEGFSKIYIPQDQFGSASINPNLMDDNDTLVVEIELKSPDWLVENYLTPSERYLIKCDIEGNDVRVLNGIPFSFWNKVDALTFELDQRSVDRLEELNELLDKLLFSGLKIQTRESKFENFDELRQLANSKSFTNTNVFMSRDSV